ncbi:hypothetical protein NM208_g15973 [Fusarium decemcellulare]|uniref:Uncharacterized protein n=1 Tax=Fusarium decemcellulare TaxID=57161 RepID=A0ACC1REV9_9HYPO|nr:hypothetical protein NM208_g15973 [Fusarium decemcellulare]
MAKTLTASLVLMASAAMAMALNPRSQTLQVRDDMCGTDQYGVDWYCEGNDTECCVGSTQGVCMPAGYSCCDTGFYCEPDETCYLVDNVQYCVKDGSDAEATRTADSDSVGETSSSKSSDDDDDEENAAANSVGNKVLVLLPLLGVMAAWL